MQSSDPAPTPAAPAKAPEPVNQYENLFGPDPVAKSTAPKKKKLNPNDAPNSRKKAPLAGVEGEECVSAIPHSKASSGKEFFYSATCPKRWMQHTNPSGFIYWVNSGM